MMTKQASLLFIKALIIGMVLNAGIAYFSDPPRTVQMTTVQELPDPSLSDSFSPPGSLVVCRIAL